MQDGAELSLELSVVGMVEDVGQFVGVGFEVVHFAGARLQVNGELGSARARGAQAEAGEDGGAHLLADDARGDHGRVFA